MPCDDNTIYRLLNNPENNWEGFLRELSLRVLTTSEQDGFTNSVFIVDDTDHPRYYSKNLEMVSWQYYHTGLCRFRRYLGFKKLALDLTFFGYYHPIDCVLSASSNHMVNDSSIKPVRRVREQDDVNSLK